MRNEKRQTIINLTAKTISYGTTMAISFFLTPYLVAKIGKVAYSFYPMANNFVNYMGVITIALNSMASRFITIALTKGDKKKSKRIFLLHLDFQLDFIYDSVNTNDNSCYFSR